MLAFSASAMDSQNLQLSHHEVRNQQRRRRFPLRVLAQDLEGPANVGGLFRIADALGVEHVYLAGSSARPPNPKLRRASRSAEKYVSYSWTADGLALARELKAAGCLLVSLEVTSSSTDIRELGWGGQRPLCLVVGSENTGVAQGLLDVSDHTLHIPMLGNNSSMNVATACGIAVFELTRGLSPSPVADAG
jgi:tRNA G18 (ribose-2'-O)-methylase SpoU